MPAVPTPLNRSRSNNSHHNAHDARAAHADIAGQAPTLVTVSNGHAATDAPPQPEFIQQYHEDSSALREQVLVGLRQSEACISPKFFYDVLGSRLFEAITDLPEYYPTRTEAAISPAPRPRSPRARAAAAAC